MPVGAHIGLLGRCLAQCPGSILAGEYYNEMNCQLDASLLVGGCDCPKGEKTAVGQHVAVQWHWVV